MREIRKKDFDFLLLRLIREMEKSHVFCAFSRVIRLFVLLVTWLPPNWRVYILLGPIRPVFSLAHAIIPATVYTIDEVFRVVGGLNKW